MPAVAALPVVPSLTAAVESQGNIVLPSTYSLARKSSPSIAKGAAIYKQQPGPAGGASRTSGWQIYKDDQLLRNPGGDHYDLPKKTVIANPPEQRSFVGRLGKDLSDVAGNLKNLVGNFLMGTTVLYRDESNQIREGHQRGLIGACTDFFKHIGSALSLGFWHPDTEKGPQGIAQRLSHVGSMLKKAVLGDLLEGIPQSINHMGKNLLLAGWNLVEVVPDATIGNFEAGKKLTTTLFDNGQVMVEYLTDIVPSGDAWLRVHASSLKEWKPPVLYNLKMPEHVKGDRRWEYVRNTPFRKTIETIGTLLADAAAIALIGQTGISGNQHSEKKELLSGIAN